jgi:hypothetical protein
MTCDCKVVQAAAVEPFDALYPTPLYPPHTWFTEKPDWLQPDTKISVDDDGRVAGYFYNAEQCLVHDHGACPRPSPTGYAAFHQQDVVLDDGETIRVGAIGNTNGHASPYARVDAAQAHYADPDRQLMAVRAYDDEHGGYILGSMVPGKTFGDVALVRRSALSGDWRPMPPQWWQSHGVTASLVNECEGYDCIGPTLVTRPGLPLVRSFVNGESRAAAILGGVGGIQFSEQEYDMTATQTIELTDGTKITTPMPMQAASPPPPPPAQQAPPAKAAPPADAQPANIEERVAQCEKAIQAIIEQINKMMQTQQVAAVAAVEAAMGPAAALPPE